MRLVSNDSQNLLRGKEKRFIYSKFTLDKYNCECKEREKSLLNQCSFLNNKQKQIFLDENTPIICKNIKNKKEYEIKCPKCKEIIAITHAKNKELNDYANLHYICWHNKISWYGTYGVNINPYNKEVTFECCCGYKDNIKNFIISEVK